MPPVAWSAWGELRNYNAPVDMGHAGWNNSGAPGNVLPARDVRLRTD